MSYDALVQRDLTPAEIDDLLRHQRIVRICFSAGGELYLLPLGYVWFDGAIHLMLSEGRKTAMLRAAPSVRGTAQVVYGNMNWSTIIMGVTPEFLEIAARVRDGLRAGHSYE